MQRDMDLIRRLMFRLEEIPLRAGVRMSLAPDEDRFQTEGVSRDEIAYHLDQIRQAGFINDGGVRPAIGIGFAGFTPAGHDFLDSVRDVDAWKGAKERAGKIGNFSLGFVTDLAKAWAKAKAAEHGWM